MQRDIHFGIRSRPEFYRKTFTLPLTGKASAHESIPLTREMIQNGPYTDEFTTRDQRRLDKNKLRPAVNRRAYDPDSLKSDLINELNRYERCGGPIHHGLLHPSRTWSESVRRNPPNGTRPFLSVPKLIPALARGDTSRFFPTGLEASLKEWIEEQPDESITPASLFGEMLRLSQGDVYLSLLTIENVLSENWICKNRQASSWLDKVVHLGHYWLGHQTPQTDQFGAWYHFFGLVLVGYAYGGSTGFLAGSIEADVDFIGKIFHHKDSPVDPQETFIGKHSGYVGGALRRKTLRRGEVASPSCASDSSRDLKANLEQSSSITCLTTSPAQ
jgi:hypothetical protein